MGVVNTVGNTLFYPITLVLYKLLVVLPNQITYYILSLINWLTGQNLMQVAMGNGKPMDSQFFKVFMFIAIVGLLIFFGALIFGIVRAYFKKNANGEINKKKNITDVLTRSITGIIIVIAIPLGFVLTTALVSYIFSMLFGVANFNTSGSSSTINAFNSYINNHWGSGPQPSNIDKINGLMVFNIWTAGYNILGEKNPSGGQLTLAQALNIDGTGKDGHDLQNVAKNVLDLMKGGSWTDGSTAITLQNADRWSVFLSVLTSLIMLYLIIMFVISVLTRLLEVYFLILIAPIVIFGGVAMEKSQGKWIVKTFHKILTVNVALLGYFIFNIIYMLLFSSFISLESNMSLRLLQFAILFAGMVLINQVPKIFMQFLNSDEAVIGNELKEASSMTRTITAPLTTAMGSMFTGTLAMMKNNQSNATRSYQPISPTNTNNNNFKF